MGIRERLFDQRDSEYREFQSRLVPNIPKDSIIGVRLQKTFSEPMKPTSF